MQQKKEWIKPRHKVILELLRPAFYLYTRLKYGITVEKFQQQGDRPYLIVMNHQTAFDQFFVSLAFNRPVYFIASEDIFSMGWVSDAIRYIAAPIAIKKQTLDLQAVKNCIKVAREGGTIALAPEGNRTYHGQTLYMKPGIASLVKKLGLPLAIFRIEDGYGIQPRWSDCVRRGKMHAGVARVVEPEEYEKLSNDELMKIITEGIHVDEAKVTGIFRHKKLAEYLERAVYVCPECGLSVFESHDDLVQCTKCGMTARYLPTKELEGVNCKFPFRFVGDWYDYQSDFINGLQLDAPEYCEELVYTDEVKLSEVILYKNKQLLCSDAQMELYGDRIVVKGAVPLEIPFSEAGVITVLGRNKLNVYFGDKVYQMVGSKRFNALKYVHFFNRYKNIAEGNPDETFLGL